MNRRGFLKGAGVAAAGVAVSFVPFIHADSRVGSAKPRLPEGAVKRVGKLTGLSHKYIFVSKYPGLRVQLTQHQAAQFHGGVYRTDDDMEAAAIMKARRQEENTFDWDVVQFGVERIPAHWFRGGSSWA